MAVEFLPFASLLSKIVDNRGRTCPTAAAGRALIATNCVRNDLLYPAYDNVRFVDEVTYRTWFRGHPQPGDLLFVTKGSPGRVCMVPEPVDFCIAQDMVALRADEDKIYPRYLFALLRSTPVQEQIEQLHVGTLIPHFKKGDFDKLLLPVPDHSTQRFVGDTYFHLSAKIELNRRTNATLEAIARALFKSWFVDFDPVRANLALKRVEATDGRPLSLSKGPAHLAGLFPAGFQDSPLGEIPTGWRVGTIGEIAANPRRTVQPRDIISTVPYIALEHMPRGSISLSDWGFAEGLESAKLEFQRGEILFGKLRPYFHKVGVAPLDGVCSTDIVVVRPRKAAWSGLVLGHVSSPAFVETVNAASTGTKMPRTNWDEMSRYPIVIPPEHVASAYAAELAPLVERIAASIHASRTLAALRDALLPKLLAGELRVCHDADSRSTVAVVQTHESTPRRT